MNALDDKICEAILINILVGLIWIKQHTWVVICEGILSCIPVSLIGTYRNQHTCGVKSAEAIWRLPHLHLVGIKSCHNSLNANKVFKHRQCA